jgi:GNAT superfamily N-acetyltransferase
VTTPAGLRSALTAVGVRPGLAGELVDGDLVFVLEGHLLVIMEADDPLVAESRVLVPVGAEPVAAYAALLAALLSLVEEVYPEAATLVLRLSAGVRPAAGTPARLLLQYVQIAPERRAEPPPRGWTVRPYRPDDRQPVADLLLQAIRDGYADLGGALSQGRPEALVDDVLDRVGQDVTVFCAEHDGSFAGHATVIEEEDELTGDQQLELFDMFVLSEHRGSPAARLLTSAAVDFAASGGMPLRGHVVGDGPGPAAVVDRLLTQGWHLAESYWRVPLRGADPA